MAVCDFRIVIPFGEDFALLGEPKRAIEGFRGQRKDRPRGGPAPATERTAASMKEREFDSMARGHVVQFDLRPLQAPARRQIAAVLRTIRVTNHHSLAVAPGADGVAIGRCLKRSLKNIRRVTKIVDRFKERNDALVQQAVIAMAAIGLLRPFPEPKHREQIICLVRHAHNVPA
jgi:hypothetical protein